MWRVWRVALLTGTAFVVGCTGAFDGFGPDREAQDGGDAGITDGAPCVDAGPDGGVCEPGFANDACTGLVAATCQPSCADAPACEAATLVATYERERCADALVDAQTFPHCTESACLALHAKVCGAEPPTQAPACVDNPGCAPAVELHARAVDPDATSEEIADAQGACAQALEDEVVFAPCNG